MTASGLDWMKRLLEAYQQDGWDRSDSADSACLRLFLATQCYSFQSFLSMQAGVGMSVDKATPSSDGFCVVREIHRGGAVDISGYEQNNCEKQWIWMIKGASVFHPPFCEAAASERYTAGHEPVGG